MANRFLLNTFDSRSTFKSVKYLIPERQKTFLTQQKILEYTEEPKSSSTGKQLSDKSQQLMVEMSTDSNRKRG